MPVNKAARFRFEIIDECLRNTKRKWSKKDLLEYVNRRLELKFGEGHIISISQIRYDIENMQSDCNAPIELYHDGKNYYYRYEDENFSIKDIPINEEEITSLNVAVQLLRQIKGFSIADEIAEIVKKLESRYGFDVEQQKEIIILECALNKYGDAYIEDIYYSIKRKNVLKVTLCLPASKKKVYNIHPYLLKEYNKRWYLVGYCQENKQIGVYDLDYMKEVKISNLPYRQDLFFNVEDYFKNIIGVTKPCDRVERVHLSFNPNLGSHIESHPIHTTQQVIKKHDDNSIDISVKIIINQDFINLLLSYGLYVTVHSPARLIQRMAEIAEQMLQSHSI